MIKKEFLCTRNLKQALNHGFALKKCIEPFSPIIKKLGQKTIHWYEHRAKKNGKNDFQKRFFKLVKSAVFGKAMEDLRKLKDLKLVTDNTCILR